MICITNHTHRRVKNLNNPKGKYAWTVKVGEKGQFVIPKEARDLFDIKPGDTLLILGYEEQGIAIPKKDVVSKYAQVIFEDVVGKKEA